MSSYVERTLAAFERLEKENARLREELADAPKCETCEAMLDCDECLRADGSQKERRRLSAENAKLRSELESVGTAAYLYGRGDLKAENAKLRELISILVHCMNEVDNCYTCPINGNPYDVRAGDWAACDTLRDMLLDMGVEVDG